MKEGEIMDDMFGIIQILLNGLEPLDKTSLKQINLKLLDSMPKIWEPKTITIAKDRDLEKLTWDGVEEVNTPCDVIPIAQYE